MASDDQSKALEEAKKLPFADRVAHKGWFVRAAAFEDIGAACKQALSPEDPLFAEVGPLFVKGVCDANANALDKALDALLLFLQNATEAQAARISGPTCSNIASKVLKGRPATVKKAADACLAFVEWEQVDAVLEPMFKAFGDKVSKAVVSALDIVTQAFSQFGPKVVKPQPITKALPTLFDAKQEPVRDGVKQLAVELCAWLGADYVQGSLCSKMPDAMRKDVEKLMETVSQRKQPERFTRKEQTVRAAAAEAAAAVASTEPGTLETATASAGPAVEENHAMDSYEYAEPVDILPSLNKEFWEGLGAKKWSERRDALQKLKALASQPRLAPGSFGDVLRELRKIILKDSNVVCVGEAILCIGSLAKSLRTHFASSAKGFVSVILEKYKDPKTSIGTAVTECLSCIHKYCLPLSELADDLMEALNHKNPKIKVDTAKLLQACVDSSSKADTAKVHSVLLPVATKGANDPAPDVREANMGVLVSFALKASNNMALLDKVSGDFEESRKKRLLELAQLRIGGGDSKAAAVTALNTARSSMSQSPAAAPVATRATSRAAAADKPVSGRPGLSKPPSKRAAAVAAPAAPADDDDAALAGGTLSESEAKQKMAELLGEEIVSGLQNAAWKERLASMEAMLEHVKGLDSVSPEAASMLIQGVAYLPGWSEKNFQVLGKAFEVITQLVNTSTVSKKDAFMAIGGLVDKMSDIKLKGPAGDALFAISEALGPQFVFTQLHKKAASHKNPKVLSESLMWMAKAVDDFGSATLNVQLLIDWMKGDLASTNAAVRNAAINLMATCHKQLGPGLAAMIRSDVKPALMTALEDSFKSNPQQQVVPTRTVRSSKPKKATAKSASAAVAADEQEATPSAFDPDELLPRADISAQLGSKVMASLGSSNWKERNHTMDDIENIIKAANRIQPSVGDLVPGLKARLTDSNKNLVARALIIFGELAKAMGPAWERVGRPVLQQAVTFLADNKKQVRDAAVAALDAWVGSVPGEKVLPAVVDFLAGPKASSEGRVTGLRWIAGVVAARKAEKCIDVVLKAAVTASGDKAVEVRDAAASLAGSVSEVHADILPAALESMSGPAKKAAADLLGKVPSAAANGHATAAAANPQQPSTQAFEPPTSARRNDAGGGKPLQRPGPLRTSQTQRTPRSRDNSVPNTPTMEGACLHLSTKKDDRTRKARFKPSKFEPPTPHTAGELEEELAPLASDSLRRLLFAEDFRQHMQAADMLLSQLEGLRREVLSCLDLLLRWAVLRICDANTQCLLKVLDLTKALFTLAIEEEYQLADGEAHSILPCLIEKSGHNQDRLRQYNKELIRMGRKLVTLPRMVEYLLQGLSTKNNRSRVDCVELLGEILEEEGFAACQRTKLKPFAAIAQLVTDRDKALRSAVLGTLEILYRKEGEAAVWSHCGSLSDQQRSLIEERFKSVAREALKTQAAAAKRRPEVVSQAPDYTETPVAPPASLPRLGPTSGRPRSRPGSNLEALQTMPFPASVLVATPSIDEAVISGRGTVQFPDTPKANGAPAVRSSQPPPGPATSPLGGGPSPPPSDIVRLEVQDDEEIHDIFTEALLMVETEDHDMCVEGAKRICYVLQNATTGRTTPEFLTFLSQSSTELVKALTTKLDEVFRWVLSEAVAEGRTEANSRPCKYMVNALMITFDVDGMAKPVPVDVLRDLMLVLLHWLLDAQVVVLLAHQPQILRGLNVLMFKILQNNFGNRIFEAMFLLLNVPHSTLQQRGLDHTQFISLLTKCLVKATKHLAERIQELDVNRLLLVIHEYFSGLGVDEIRRRGTQDEQSLRMVKTLVHEMCRVMGEEIRLHMDGIPRVSDPIPIIHVYVDLHLETLHAAGVIPASAPSSARSSRDNLYKAAELGHARSASLQSLHYSASSLQSLNMPTASATITQRSSKDLKPAPPSQPSGTDTLLGILQRVGDGTTSEQGLQELHRFMKEHPEVDTKPVMDRLSKDFHAFVEKGLQRLDRRERTSKQLSRASSDTSQDSLSNGHSANGAANDSNISSLGARFGGMRVSVPSPSERVLTMGDVELMQGRMNSLRRSPSSQ